MKLLELPKEVVFLKLWPKLIRRQILLTFEPNSKNTIKSLGTQTNNATYSKWHSKANGNDELLIQDQKYQTWTKVNPTKLRTFQNQITYIKSNQTHQKQCYPLFDVRNIIKWLQWGVNWLKRIKNLKLLWGTLQLQPLLNDFM